MAKTHHGGKVGAAAAQLARKTSSAKTRRSAASTLATHKHKMH